MDNGYGTKPAKGYQDQSKNLFQQQHVEKIFIYFIFVNSNFSQHDLSIEKQDVAKPNFWDILLSRQSGQYIQRIREEIVYF